jgi:hypothetical protein
VQVKETPQYARATSTASMDVRVTFEKPRKRIHITPVERNWTAQKKGLVGAIRLPPPIIHRKGAPRPLHAVSAFECADATKIEKIFGSYAVY